MLTSTIATHLEVFHFCAHTEVLEVAVDLSVHREELLELHETSQLAHISLQRAPVHAEDLERLARALMVGEADG